MKIVRDGVEFEVNDETINDRAKLIMHRLIARRLAYDSSMIVKAKEIIRRKRGEKPGYSYYDEWDELLNLPVDQLRRVIVERSSRGYDMRNTSPLPVAMAPYFFDTDFRRRIYRKAKLIILRPKVQHREP